MADRDDRDRPRPPSSPAVSKSPDIEVRVAGDDDGVRHRGAAGQESASARRVAIAAS